MVLWQFAQFSKDWNLHKRGSNTVQYFFAGNVHWPSLRSYFSKYQHLIMWNDRCRISKEVLPLIYNNTETFLYPIWSYNRNARLESWTCPFRRDMNELIKNRFYCTNLPDISLLLLPWQYVCFAFVTTKTMALKMCSKSPPPFPPFTTQLS